MTPLGLRRIADKQADNIRTYIDVACDIQEHRLVGDNLYIDFLVRKWQAEILGIGTLPDFCLPDFAAPLLLRAAEIVLTQDAIRGFLLVLWQKLEEENRWAIDYESHALINLVQHLT